MALLTGEIVADYVNEGYEAIAVASSVAFWVGIYSLILGIFRLGFLLDFIPLPVLSGYVSGAALTILLQQLKALFGEPKTGDDVAGVIRYFFRELPNTNWRAFLIGITGIILLGGMQQLGRRLGKKYRAVWYFSIARNALAIILYTLISWGVNKDRKSPLFSISKVTGTGVLPPANLDMSLVMKLPGRSIAVFVAAALEHLAIGKAFGRVHGYEIDEDQELTFLGVLNVFTSFFHCMPVTGGFSRTAVNSESGVKSPLSGLICAACVLVSIYKLTGAFYWIPSSTLAAIIIVAVYQIIVPPRIFWHYWMTSFSDFLGCMIGFWVTLFDSVEIGIACGAAYSLVYVLLRLAFTRVVLVQEENLGTLYPMCPEPTRLPEDSMVFALQDSILYPNAKRVTRQVCHSIYTHTSPDGEHDLRLAKDDADRIWNDTRTKLIASLRRDVGIAPDAVLPKLRVVVLDMTRVGYLDITGVQALADIKKALKDWSGPDAELRFIGLNERLRARLERAEEYFDVRPKPQEGEVIFDVLHKALSEFSSKATSEAGEKSSPEDGNLTV